MVHGRVKHAIRGARDTCPSQVLQVPWVKHPGVITLRGFMRCISILCCVDSGGSRASSRAIDGQDVDVLVLLLAGEVAVSIGDGDGLEFALSGSRADEGE